MSYRFERVHPEASTHRTQRRPPVRERRSEGDAYQMATKRVSAALGDRFTWFLSPIRIKAIAEDLRVLHRQRDLDLGIVVIAVILSAFMRSSDTEGRVRDAFAIYRQIDTEIDVVDEAFRKAMIRSADVLLHLLQEWTRQIATLDGRPQLRGRLAFFKDLLLTDSTAFKLARALAFALPGSGTTAALKLHGVYSVRAQVAVSVTATSGSEHDSPHFQPSWVAGALYLWDLGYNDYARVIAAHLAGAFLVQRLKDRANMRVVAWYDTQGVRHLTPRGPRGGLPLLDDLLAMTPALQDGGVVDLDVVLADAEVSCILRVVCVPTDGQDRYYLTNLPRAHFSPCDVAEIYSSRWEIELLYKDWQGGCRLDEVARLSNLHTLRAVIYGGLLAHLLSRELACAANEGATDTAERSGAAEAAEAAEDDGRSHGAANEGATDTDERGGAAEAAEVAEAAEDDARSRGAAMHRDAPRVGVGVDCEATADDGTQNHLDDVIAVDSLAPSTSDGLTRTLAIPNATLPEHRRVNDAPETPTSPPSSGEDFSP